ncbi:BQ5605_C034g11247 [Microbotryum silenes-dioicae]|uniref:BQ5605_C034g11247 protein n=1 Tax=Microbotryum silenes-dioicae TaxID=796604 RepID=A0A2X0PGV9_9BASI|nr:BQ5605_C034g11247 [Microbotryum silenes-dioicae]
MNCVSDRERKQDAGLYDEITELDRIPSVTGGMPSPSPGPVFDPDPEPKQEEDEGSSRGLRRSERIQRLTRGPPKAQLGVAYHASFQYQSRQQSRFSKGVADVTFPSIDPNGGFLANAVYCLARNCIRIWARMNIIDEHSLGHMCRAQLQLTSLRLCSMYPMFSVSFTVEKRLKVACPVQRMDLATPDTASRRAAPIECTKPRMTLECISPCWTILLLMWDRKLGKLR